MRVTAEIVPNFFTMSNLFCGFYSIILSAQGKFNAACWLIIAAGVFDVLDGKMARFTRSSSSFGVQYDSLADVISFGVAPSVLVYFVFLSNWTVLEGWKTAGVLLSFVNLAFGSIRLARFNIRAKGPEKEAFEGLPIPASAFTIATFVLFNNEIWGYLRWEKLFISILIIVSLLMVFTIRYEKMPNFNMHGSAIERIKMLGLVLAFFIILAYPHETFFPLMALYIISGPIRFISLVVNPPKKKAKGHNA